MLYSIPLFLFPSLGAGFLPAPAFVSRWFTRTLLTFFAFRPCLLSLDFPLMFNCLLGMEWKPTTSVYQPPASFLPASDKGAIKVAVITTRINQPCPFGWLAVISMAGKGLKRKSGCRRQRATCHFDQIVKTTRTSYL